MPARDWLGGARCARPSAASRRQGEGPPLKGAAPPRGGGAPPRLSAARLRDPRVRGAALPAPLAATPAVSEERLRRAGWRPRRAAAFPRGRRSRWLPPRPALPAPPSPHPPPAEAGHGAAGGCLRGGSAAPPRLRLHQLLLVRAAGGRGRGRRAGQAGAARRVPPCEALRQRES